MCLILFAHRAHPRYRLVLAANRDEFHDRPSVAAAEWEDAPGVFGGRDLRSGGTWLGVTSTGRWSAVTNYRDPSEFGRSGPSRGRLVADFLRSDATGEAYLEEVVREAHRYPGFNLLVGDGRDVFWTSNRLPRAAESAGHPPYHRLAAGVYGLSNHLLDTPWPKVERGRGGLSRLLEAADEPGPGTLLHLLMDRAVAADTDLPATGVPLDLERALSAPFITLPDYGTRASSALLIGTDASILLAERRFDGRGAAGGETLVRVAPPARPPSRPLDRSDP